MDNNIEHSNVKTVTMNELLGVEHLTILQGGQPIYVTSHMCSEWRSEDVQYFLDMDDRTGDRILIVAATDVVQASLPRPSKLGSDEQVYKRFKARIERTLQRVQIQRSLRLMPVDGYETDRDIYIPSYVDKPITFVPFGEWNEVHRSLAVRGEMMKQFNSTMYEVFKDDGMVR